MRNQRKWEINFPVLSQNEILTWTKCKKYFNVGEFCSQKLYCRVLSLTSTAISKCSVEVCQKCCSLSSDETTSINQSKKRMRSALWTPNKKLEERVKNWIDFKEIWIPKSYMNLPTQNENTIETIETKTKNEWNAMIKSGKVNEWTETTDQTPTTILTPPWFIDCNIVWLCVGKSGEWFDIKQQSNHLVLFYKWNKYGDLTKFLSSTNLKYKIKEHIKVLIWVCMV